ncbi:sigma-54-dependent transcriptional regulator [Bartonella sp. LJL80]
MQQPFSVYFIDDDEDLRHANVQSLQLAGFNVDEFRSAEQSLDAALENCLPDVIVCDIRLGGMSGQDLLDYWSKRDAELPIILITGHGDIDMAVDAIRKGAYDFLAKPYDNDRLVEAIRRAGEMRRLVLENRKLRLLAENTETTSPLIGEAPAMESLRHTISQLADMDVDVLVEGETGTGKEIVAQLLHTLGKRSRGAFVALNCGALPEPLIESELFGHVAGAFTSAEKKRIGLIQGADRGTLFLDEIESMPVSAQVKLLRVLETRMIQPLGADKPIEIDFRVVAAAQQNLGAQEARERFRSDLYYRLNVVTLRIPPLRERRQDIPLLLAYFLQQSAKRFQRDVPNVPTTVHRMIKEHDWPGNVRELLHLADRLVLGVPGCHQDESAAEELSLLTLAEQMDRHEEAILRSALEKYGGSVSETTKALGLPRKTFYDKLARYSITRRDFQRPETNSI